MVGESFERRKAYSYCRLCLNGCPIEVELDGTEPVKIRGVKDNPVYRGFTCVKGRNQINLLNHPERLRSSLKRGEDGKLHPVSHDQAIDEIAEKLAKIIAERGPRSVAGYLGTQFAASATTMPMFMGFMQAIGSPMIFSPATIDKPGKKIAQAFHGSWNAPATEFDSPEVICLLGANPLVTFTGFPYGNPGKWLNELTRNGTQLIVIDPRESDVARRAHIHLQCRPGHDVQLLASMLHVIVDQGLWDSEFADRYISGIDDLKRAVAPFEPRLVAQMADVDADKIVSAAHLLASTRRGYINCGTGPNMAGYGSLVEYLALNLHSLCGYWLREGDRVRHPGVLVAPKEMTADVIPPAPAHGFGERMSSRDLGMSAAGMPTAALADEILTTGEKGVRALISCGGNPVGAWPDQNKTVRAMRELDLLVQIDPWMSGTSQLADYVIAPRLGLEVAGHTQVLDWLTRYGVGYGQEEPYAQYVDAIVPPPAGSDLIEDWEFFYELARRMDLGLSISACVGPEMPAFAVDMQHKPTTEELLEAICKGSRIDLDEVKKHPSGAIFRGEECVVGPRDPANLNRLDVANGEMLADLAAYAPEPRSDPQGNEFRLIVRRMMHVYNSSWIGALPDRSLPYNPAFLNPDDMDDIGIKDGDTIKIVAGGNSIEAVGIADATLRRGVASMSFGFGSLPDADINVREIGSNPTCLVRDDEIWDRYSGQPRMTNIPVEIARAPTNG